VTGVRSHHDDVQRAVDESDVQEGMVPSASSGRIGVYLTLETPAQLGWGAMRPMARPDYFHILETPMIAGGEETDR
jgi:hypothetical protein